MLRPLFAAQLLLTAFCTIGHGAVVEPAARLSSVSEAHALAESEYAAEIPFCLTGLVTQATIRPGNRERLCLLHTTDGDCSLWSSNVHFRSGDIIQATGFTELNFFAKDRVLHTTNVIVLGHGPIPEPQLLSQADILSGKGDYKTIRVRGFFTDAFEDDIDGNYVIALLNVAGRIFHVSAVKKPDTLQKLQALIDADIELTGDCSPIIGGKRMFGGPMIHCDMTTNSIRVLTPPTDPFKAPPLRFSSRQLAESVAAMKRRSVRGTVLAAWQGRNVLLSYDGEHIARLELADGEIPPIAGDDVVAAGFPQTDLYNINLSHALVQVVKRTASPETDAMSVSADTISHHPFTKRFDHDFHGRLVRLTGIVRSVPTADRLQERLAIEDNGILVPIDSGNRPEIFADIEIGSKVEVTGVCVMESENWRPQRIVPIITGFFLVIRAPGDVRVLSHPPRWTPRRFLVALFGLCLVTVVILVWNHVLRKLVERRSRELTRAQAAQAESELRLDERTRIATELHDYLAQNLTAVSYKLTSARAAREKDPESADAQLDTAVAMLDSSRTELRRCLWDLKSHALEEPTFDQAIRRSLQQITDFKNLDLSFNVPCAHVSDPTAHAILSVIRELVANAVNHGLADRITIRGEIKGDSLVISVTDNGYGFDTGTAASSDDGHFGLDGIRQRVKRLDGSFEIASRPANGTQAVVRIPFLPAL